MNPNNCKTCDYTKINGNREGHCYMFRDEPSDVCSQYTSRNNPLRAFGDALADAMEDMPELRDALIASGAVMPNALANAPARTGD